MGACRLILPSIGAGLQPNPAEGGHEKNFDDSPWSVWSSTPTTSALGCLGEKKYELFPYRRRFRLPSRAKITAFRDSKLMTARRVDQWSPAREYKGGYTRFLRLRAHLMGW